MDLSDKLSADAFAVLTQRLLDCDNVERVELFVLDLSSAHFRKQGGIGPVEIESFTKDEIDIVKELLGRNFGAFFHQGLYRGANQIAHIFVFGDEPNERKIASLTRDIPFIYNRRHHEKLVFGLHEQVAFGLDNDEFFERLSNIARVSSGIQYGAYRTVNRDSAEYSCIFNWGFDDLEITPSQMSIKQGEISAIDRAVRDQQPVYCRNLLLEHPNLSNNHSFRNRVVSFCAIPVLVGTKLFGVISFGVGLEYEFSEIEMNSLLCISNGIGVSLNYFRLQYEGKTQGAEFDKISSAIVGVEVAQSIRHNILKSSGNIVKSVSLVDNRVSNSSATKAEKEKISVTLARAREDALEIETEVRNLKDVMSVERTVRLTNVKTLWQECSRHLGYEIEDQRVALGDIRSHTEVPLLADLVKNIFHNLMLNSLDAFGTTSKQGRRISLSLDRFSMSDRVIDLTYSDNGPGLEISRLMQVRERLAKNVLTGVTEATPLGELIFRLRLTTRTEGSGHGLYLCRQMASYHAGGIEYVSPPDGVGVAFKIRLSFDIYKLIDANSEPLLIRDTKTGLKEELDPEVFLREQQKRK